MKNNENTHKHPVYSRRNFLTGIGLAAGGTALGGATAAAADPNAPKAGYRTLGKTGLKISTISMGTVGAQDVGFLKFGFAQGINFIHTAPNYSNGRSIINVGKALEGIRKDIVLGLKCTFNLDNDEGMDKALATLGTDHVDIAFFPIHKESQVADEKYRIAAERWKKSGKCRFVGLTSHQETVEVLMTGMKQGFYDIIMPAYNIEMEQEFAQVWAEARKQNLGVVLMKTKRGLDGDDYNKAVARYLETKPVTTVLKGMLTFVEVQELLKASHIELAAADREMLQEKARIAMAGHCAMCGNCTSICPENILVSDIVRCSDYYLNSSSMFELAKETYSELPGRRDAGACLDCGICEQQCPHQVPIIHHLRRAEKLLA